MNITPPPKKNLIPHGVYASCADKFTNDAEEVALSVIVPAYNASEHIEKCVRSVLVQETEGFHIELIVVNDGSTDNTKEIVSALRVDFPKVRLIDKLNGGISSARNMGLKEANGKYVYFLDSDDFVAPNCLFRLYEEAVVSDTEILMFGTIFAHPDDYDRRSEPVFEVFKQTNAIEYLKRTRGGLWMGRFGEVSSIVNFLSQSV